MFRGPHVAAAALLVASFTRRGCAAAAPGNRDSAADAPCEPRWCSSAGCTARDEIESCPCSCWTSMGLAAQTTPSQQVDRTSGPPQMSEWTAASEQPLPSEARRASASTEPDWCQYADCSLPSSTEMCPRFCATTTHTTTTQTSVSSATLTLTSGTVTELTSTNTTTTCEPDWCSLVNCAVLPEDHECLCSCATGTDTSTLTTSNTPVTSTTTETHTTTCEQWWCSMVDCDSPESQADCPCTCATATVTTNSITSTTLTTGTTVSLSATSTTDTATSTTLTTTTCEPDWCAWADCAAGSTPQFCPCRCATATNTSTTATASSSTQTVTNTSVTATTTCEPWWCPLIDCEQDPDANCPCSCHNGTSMTQTNSTTATTSTTCEPDYCKLVTTSCTQPDVNVSCPCSCGPTLPPTPTSTHTATSLRSATSLTSTTTLTVVTESTPTVTSVTTSITTTKSSTNLRTTAAPEVVQPQTTRPPSDSGTRPPSNSGSSTTEVERSSWFSNPAIYVLAIACACGPVLGAAMCTYMRNNADKKVPHTGQEPRPIVVMGAMEQKFPPPYRPYSHERPGGRDPRAPAVGRPHRPHASHGAAATRPGRRQDDEVDDTWDDVTFLPRRARV